jgi:flagellar biosynthetic protein FlhB
MSLFDDQSEARTERPTERRRRQARERGMVARSVELLIAARLLAIWILLAWWFATFVNSASSSLRAALDERRPDLIAPTTALVQLRDLAWQILASASWPLLISTAALLVAHFAQVGWLWNWENAAPQLSRLSPVMGLQRLLSWTTIGRALQQTLKLTVIASASSFTLLQLLPLPRPNLSADMTNPLTAIESSAGQLGAHIALAALTFGALDYVWQRWRFERSLLMTREELRDELKEIEGDSRLKSHRQELARQFPAAPIPSQSNTGPSS